MRLLIDHDTVYRYEAPARYTIQTLRLTPQPFDGQAVQSWSVEAVGAGPMPSIVDAYGNLTHTLTIDHPHDEVRIHVRGKVQTTDTNGVVTGSIEPLPDYFYRRETDLTEANGAIRAIARAAQADAEGELDCGHRLMAAVRDAIDYRIGETDVATTAAEALDHGYGVCQDHAHVFIAAARSLGMPARYVSGYLLAGDDEEEYEASHAWAELRIPDLGWVGFDVSNGVCPSEIYVRVAVGLDYYEAAPVRGVRRGGETEKLDVSVRVIAQQQADGAQQ